MQAAKISMFKYFPNCFWDSALKTSYQPMIVLKSIQRKGRLELYGDKKKLLADAMGPTYYFFPFSLIYVTVHALDN
jgi:hypothetical protein